MRYNSTVAKSGANALTRFTGWSTRYYTGSVGIRVVGVFARRAPEGRLVGPVLFRDVSALRAFQRGVAGIDKNQRHSGHCRFVSDEQPQLRERPTVENYSLLAPNRNPLANAAQVFELDSASCAFSASDDLFTYHVIGVAGEALFLARKFLQSPLRRPSLRLLKLGPQATMPEPNRFCFGAAMPFAIGGRCDIAHSKIHTEKLRRFYRRIGRQIDRTEQMELSLAVNQIGLSLDAVEALPLVLAVDQGNDYTLLRQGPQTHLVDALEPHNALVVCDRAERLEGGTNLLVPRKTLHRLADGADGHLRRQAKPRADLGISEFMDRRLAKHTGIEAATSRKRSRFIASRHCFEQTFSLLGIRQQLQLERQLHQLGVYHSLIAKSSNREAVLRTANLFLCQLKQAVSKVHIL
jgi:hypothetical protein